MNLNFEPGDPVEVLVPQRKTPLAGFEWIEGKVLAQVNDENDPEGYFRKGYGEGYWVDTKQSGDPKAMDLFGKKDRDIRGLYVCYFEVERLRAA